MTSTQTEKAVVGRRVTFTYHRDRGLPDPPAYPGIITSTEPGLSGCLLAVIRLDGHRSHLHIPVDYEGLTYLDEVTEVPDLPMGRFLPVADDRHGLWEYEGVLLATVGEDGENLVLLTDDPAKARAAATTYLTETGVDLDYVHFDSMRALWVVFAWEPDDSEYPWTWSDASEDDDQAVHVYYLPA